MPGVLCVGRDDVLDLVRSNVARAGKGSGGVLLIDGPAGIGKTTVARFCLAETAGRGGGAHMVAAMGPDLEPPLGMWSRLAASASVAGLRVPGVLLDGAVEQLHPHARYAAVLDLVSAIAPAPSLVVLDDLHSADESSLTILSQLAPALGSTGVLVVGTLRAPTAHPTESGRTALTSLAAWAPVVTLERLDVDGVRALMLANADANADASAEEWARATDAILAERSGGIPLVLQAIIDDLGVRNGARPSPAQLADLPVGSAVVDVMARRLRMLSSGAREMLNAMALIGSSATVALVEEVLERDVADDLRQARHGGVVLATPHGNLEFSHPAVVDAILADMPGGSSAVHHRIAGALRRRGRPGDLPAIARHLHAAGPVVAPAIVAGAAIDAAEYALRHGDHAAAAQAFDVALGTGASPDPVDLLLRGSQAHHLAGHREEGWQRAHRAAVLTGDTRPDELARAALSYAQGRDYATDTSLAVTLLRRSLAGLSHEHALRPVVLAALSVLEMSLPIVVDQIDVVPGASNRPADTVAWHWITRPEIARPLADEALSLARASGDEELVARVATSWRQSFCDPARLDDRLAVTEHALEWARDPTDRAAANVASVLDHLEAGDRDRVDRALTELAGLADATGDPAVRWREAQLRSMVALASGDVGLAEAHSVEAFAHGAQADENGRWVVRTAQSLLISFESDADLARPVGELLEHIDSFAYPPLRAGAAYGLVVAGRIADATPLLPDLVDHLVRGDSAREASWLVTAGMAADAIVGTDLAGELGQLLLPAIEPFADHIAVDGLGLYCHGCLARPISRLHRALGHIDAAERLVAQATARDHAAGLQRFLLQGRLDELAVASQSGDDPQWEDAVKQLSITATAAGLHRIARGAGALLPAGRDNGAPRLTDRQLEVLASLADGATYQAIGHRLGFSHSTIRHEAIRIYAELGAHDRVAAVETAQGLGLI